MPDMEKVIHGLKQCPKLPFALCFTECTNNSCPYYDEDGINNLHNDALALLKEQEAVKPKSKVRHGANAQIQHFCGNCNSMLHGKPRYCSECGKGVLW